MAIAAELAEHGVRAKDITGRIFIAAGGFVGEFARQAPAIIGYRDHKASPPWSVNELHARISR